jgi:hypothetical protein
MRYGLIAARLAVGVALVGVIQVVNVPTAQGEVRVNIGVPAPYFYSRHSCEGCWYGTWRGRDGYHRGGGEPWGRSHFERDHYRNGYHGGRGYHGDQGHEGHGR